MVVSGTDTRDVAFAATANISVKDEPVITGLTPAAGSQTGENKRPVISAAIANAGENPRVEMTVAGAAVDAVYANGTVTYTPLEDLAEGRTSVTVTVTRADGKAAAKTWSFTVGVAAQQAVFWPASTPHHLFRRLRQPGYSAGVYCKPAGERQHRFCGLYGPLQLL
ncbi:MAG: hypothetical protein ACLSHU_01945 [Oscillospiraceae bacterium]